VRYEASFKVSAKSQSPEPWEAEEGIAESGKGPRAQTLTLVGVGPASGAVVVGAVARPASVPPPVPTNRNLFDAIDPASDEPDDEAWPDPPRAEAAAVAPASAPAPAPASATEQRLPPRTRSRSSLLLWIVPAVAVVGLSAVVAWRQHTARLDVARPAVATALPVLLPPAAPAQDPAPPRPAPEPSTTSATTTVPPFDGEAAESALAETAKAVARCRYGEVYGKGQATVTFGVDGAVTECSVSRRFRWTATGACVKAALSAVHTAPFAGGPETMVHPFEVAPR
jgi:hypothetical protein